MALVVSVGKEAHSEPDQAETDVLLRGIWSEMCKALSHGDIEKALTFYATTSREKYRSILTALRDQLPQLVREMQAIELVQIEGNTAIYRVRKLEQYGSQTVNMAYHIKFGHDFDGSWKIYEY